MNDTTRRHFLAGTAGVIAATAGCGGGSIPEEADIVAGPDGRFVYDPADYTAAVGDTVRWYFDSTGHNVSCRPEDSDQVELPEGAEGFATYGPDESPARTVTSGQLFAHTFDTAGTYTYVCIPHVSAGMVGTVTIE